MGEMRKRWQEAVSSRETLASELGSATAPLLRQISSMQEVGLSLIHLYARTLIHSRIHAFTHTSTLSHPIDTHTITPLLTYTHTLYMTMTN